jgi:hypothetical protein
MKKGFLPLALIVVIIAGMIAAVGSASGSALRSNMALHVVERATTDVVTDLGDEGDSVGDVLTFANEIFDENNETVIGSDNGYCVRTNVGVAWECIWTLTLENGQLMVEGPFNDAGDSILAITGGTGDYMGARGQMTLVWRNEDGTEFDFIYEVFAE